MCRKYTPDCVLLPCLPEHNSAKFYKSQYNECYLLELFFFFFFLNFYGLISYFFFFNIFICIQPVPRVGNDEVSIAAAAAAEAINKRAGTLTKESFDRCIRGLVPGRRLSQGQKERFSGLLSAVFFSFDFDGRWGIAGKIDRPCRGGGGRVEHSLMVHEILHVVVVCYC